MCAHIAHRLGAGPPNASVRQTNEDLLHKSSLIYMHVSCAHVTLLFCYGLVLVNTVKP